MKISKKKAIALGVFFIVLLIGVSSYQNDDQSKPVKTTESTSAPEVAKSNDTEKAGQQNDQNTTVDYEILNTENGKLADNIWVLIEPGESGENAARAVKQACKKPCLIQVYDNKEAYLLDAQYTEMLSDLDTPQSALTEWKEKNYVFVADHLVGSILNGEDEYKAYPMRDWYYEEQKKNSSTFRQQIFREVVAAEDKGREEAEELFPTDITHPSYQEGNIEKMLSLMDELQEKYRNEVLSRHNLTKEDFKQISVEALRNDWSLD